METNFAAIAAVLGRYFDGLYHSDTALLRSVFHAKAHYVCATEGTLVHLGMDEYFPIVDRRPSPASRNEVRADRIVAIEFAGPVTAFARVECAIGAKSPSRTSSKVTAWSRPDCAAIRARVSPATGSSTLCSL